MTSCSSPLLYGVPSRVLSSQIFKQVAMFRQLETVSNCPVSMDVKRSGHISLGCRLVTEVTSLLIDFNYSPCSNEFNRWDPQKFRNFVPSTGSGRAEISLASSSNRRLDRI